MPMMPSYLFLNAKIRVGWVEPIIFFSGGKKKKKKKTILTTFGLFQFSKIFICKTDENKTNAYAI